MSIVPLSADAARYLARTCADAREAIERPLTRALQTPAMVLRHVRWLRKAREKRRRI